jgi:hypothetical protein
MDGGVQPPKQTWPMSTRAPGAVFDLADRRRRARCYEVVLREGSPADLLRFVDGALLVDAWADLVLPRELRAAWQPVIDAVLP